MEDRGYKNDLRKLILDMAQREIENYVSKAGAQKYFEGNVDKIINNNINKFVQGNNINKKYIKTLKHSSNQNSVSSVSRIIKKDTEFKKKRDLINFANYLGVKVNSRLSYNQILKRVSTHIYTNRQTYSNKYVFYNRGKDEYILEPQKIKLELIESYKSKTRDNMKSIAKLLDVQIDEDYSAEDIRKTVINYIIKEKISKNIK